MPSLFRMVLAAGCLPAAYLLCGDQPQAATTAVGLGLAGAALILLAPGYPSLTRRLRATPSYKTPILRAVSDQSSRWCKCPPSGPLAAMCVNERLGQVTWAMFYESTPAVGTLDRRSKEAIAEGVSRGNACKFCGDMHETMRECCAVVASQPDEAALRAWALKTSAAIRFEPASIPTLPLQRQQQPEALSIVVVMNSINRISECFAPAKPPTDMMPAFAKPMVKAMMGWLTGMTGPAGASFDAVLLTGTELMKPSTEREHCNEEELPSQLRSVLARSPALLKAVQAWSRACVREGRRVMKDGTRAVLRAAVKEWNGEQTLTAGKDIARLVDAAPHDEEKALLRLALTAAIAPSRLTDDVVEVGTDDQRVVAVAYGACEVSKEIGDRVASTFE